MHSSCALLAEQMCAYLLGEPSQGASLTKGSPVGTQRTMAGGSQLPRPESAHPVHIPAFGLTTGPPLPLGLDTSR